MLKLVILILFTSNACTETSASLVKLNATTSGSLPPLYALDDWNQCQQSGDVYCIVDAALTATKKSPLLELLQEYSSQALKHYNRTQIHRGLCVTKCDNDTTGSWRDSAQRCVTRQMRDYGLDAQVLNVDWCTSPNSEAGTGGTGGARALAVFSVVLLALVLATTALDALCESCLIIGGNKYLLAFSLRQNWKILTYDRSKPRTDDRMKDVACMEGVRFLGMQTVIFSHVLFVYLYSYIDNPQFVEKMYDQFFWQAVFNSPLWLQVFFSLSGFLTAFSVLISSEKSPITFLKCINSIVSRWIRVTPLAAFALWFTISWFPLLGTGPQWSWLVTREAHDCSERWWYHLLYVHNHLPLGKLCMGHTWYLAVDMQLHVVGIFVVFLLVRYRRAVAPVLAGLVAASAIAAGVVVYVQGLNPIVNAQSPEAFRSLFSSSALISKIMSQLYLPSWMNLSGYMCGVGVAFILYYNQTNGVKLNECKWFNILFHLSLTLGGCVVISGVVFLSDSPPAPWASALYAALDRTLVAIFFNVFMLGCVSRCQSAFRKVLDWRGFHTLGRLSYSAFLFHFIVLRLTLASNTQLGHANGFSMVVLLVTASTITYAVSIPLVLLIELPALQLWKAFTEGGPRPPPSPRAPTPPALAKTFDLVAHIRRRHEV